MAIFAGGREDWDRLTLTGAVTPPRARRRMRRLLRAAAWLWTAIGVVGAGLVIGVGLGW